MHRTFPSHVSLNAVCSPRSYSGWVLDDEPLDYVNAPLLSFSMLSGMVTGEYVGAFEKSLNKASAQTIDSARIPVENINGPIVLVSAKQDEIWPSYEMANQIEQRLEQQGFTHEVRHIALEGGHYSYDRKTMDEVLTFLQENFATACAASSN